MVRSLSGCCYNNNSRRRRRRWKCSPLLGHDLVVVVVLLLLLFVWTPPPPGFFVVAQQSSSSSSSSVSSVSSSIPRFDCNPCIERSEYTIKVITHGTTNDLFWTQVQSAAFQAGRDMGVQLDMKLYDPTNNDNDNGSSNSGKTIGELMTQDILNTIDGTTNQPLVDGLIVTIYDENVQNAIKTVQDLASIPIFAFNVGYDIFEELGVLGYVGQEEYIAGQVAAQELIKRSTSNNSTQNTPKNVLLLNHNPTNPAVRARINGLTDTLQQSQSQQPNDEDDNVVVDVSITEIALELSDIFDTVTEISDAFRGCPYDSVIVLGGATVDVVLRAVEKDGCQGVLIGTFDESSDIYTAIANGDIQFTISQQQYLQSVLPVMMASLYVTTGKKLALPRQTNGSNEEEEEEVEVGNATTTTTTTASTGRTSSTTTSFPVFQSGPSVIDLSNLPSDTQQTCASESFPICPNTWAPDGRLAQCKCFDRSTIRIGGVVHGVTSDTFWDIAFAAAEQTAVDLGIDLDFQRFQPEPTGNNQIIRQKMANKIKALCDSGVDGIFVSIPSDDVIPAIQECQALNIPVISLNTGAEASAQLGLLQHVGMLEYNGGYEAAQRMIKAGMKTAYCLDHDPGNTATQERCRGFEDGITQYVASTKAGGPQEVVIVTYSGTVEVPLDVQIVFKNQIEDAVGYGGDWNGVGLLVLGSHLIKAAQGVKEAHPNVLIGSFDTSEDLVQGIDDGSILFGIDQQVYLQGSTPVYLLAYAAYTRQQLGTQVLETGPNFITSVPSKAETFCEANFFQACEIRPKEDFNFISRHLLALGYFLIGTIVLFSIIAYVWIYLYQTKSPLVTVSQPMFLVLVLFGCVMSSLSILTMGRQTGYRSSSSSDGGGEGGILVTENPEIAGVDAACMASWWLYGIGFAIIFAALFAKIRRVKIVYHASVAFRRKTVQKKEVAYILVIMIACEVTILLAWQLISPERWERNIITEEDGFVTESVGECTSERGWIFAVILSLFHTVSLLYALVLCFETKHIPSEFAESNWISLAVMSLFQILVITIPIYLMVEDDTNIFYFVRMCAVFLQNFTVFALIFGPKMYRVYIGDDQLSGNFSGRVRRMRGRNSSAPRISHLDLRDTCFHCGSTLDMIPEIACGSGFTTASRLSLTGVGSSSLDMGPSVPVGRRRSSVKFADTPLGSSVDLPCIEEAESGLELESENSPIDSPQRRASKKLRLQDLQAVMDVCNDISEDVYDSESEALTKRVEPGSSAEIDDGEEEDDDVDPVTTDGESSSAEPNDNSEILAC